MPTQPITFRIGELETSELGYFVDVDFPGHWNDEEKDSGKSFYSAAADLRSFFGFFFSSAIFAVAVNFATLRCRRFTFFSFFRASGSLFWPSDFFAASADSVFAFVMNVLIVPKLP
tara:strand:+ start:2917 stop:3264 length:348 start_codon:yes stop_codon:yes gene_type:complete